MNRELNAASAVQPEMKVQGSAIWRNLVAPTTGQLRQDARSAQRDWGACAIPYSGKEPDGDLLWLAGASERLSSVAG